jgi:hypothetical protein
MTKKRKWRVAHFARRYELVKETSPKFDVKKVKFPFWKDVAKKGTVIEEAHIRTAADYVPHLVEAWQPSLGGASQLFLLHQLDIADKHRLLIPTMLGAWISHSQLAFAHDPELSTAKDMFPEMQKVYDGRVVMCVAAGLTAPPIGTRNKASCALALDDIPGMPVGDGIGHELLETLSRLSNVTRNVLWSFEANTEPIFEPPKRREPVQLENGVWQCPPEMTPEQLDAWIRDRVCSAPG